MQPFGSSESSSSSPMDEAENRDFGVSGVCAYMMRPKSLKISHVIGSSGSTEFRETPGKLGPGSCHSVLRSNFNFLEISLRAPFKFQRCCSVLRQNLVNDINCQKVTPCSRLPGNWPRTPREFGESHSRNYSVLFLKLFLNVCRVSS